jgi:hypothetical protein
VSPDCESGPGHKKLKNLCVRLSDTKLLGTGQTECYVTITIKVTLKTQEQEEKVWHYSERCYIYGYVVTLKFPRLCPLVLLVSRFEVR